jgi:hypothetical protein
LACLRHSHTDFIPALVALGILNGEKLRRVVGRPFLRAD